MDTVMLHKLPVTAYAQANSRIANLTNEAKIMDPYGWRELPKTATIFDYQLW